MQRELSLPRSTCAVLWPIDGMVNQHVCGLRRGHDQDHMCSCRDTIPQDVDWDEVDRQIMEQRRLDMEMRAVGWGESKRS